MRSDCITLALWLVMGAAAPQVRTTASVKVSDFAEGDLSVRIKRADVSLGSGCGEVVVDVPGTIVAPVALSPCRTLKLLAKTTWSAPITVASHDKIIGNGAASEITGKLTSNDAKYVSGTSVEDIEVANVRLSVEGEHATAVYLAGFEASKHVRIHNNEVRNGYVAAFSSIPGYANVNDTALNRDVSVTGNASSRPKVDDRGAGVLMTYTDGFAIDHNRIEGGSNGIQWWGGDADKDGARANPRWARHGVISDNSVASVSGGGIWGSMGDTIEVRHNTVNGCGDTCLDAEGSNHVHFIANTASGGGGGGTASIFFLNQDITFEGNSLVQQRGFGFRVWNASQSAQLNEDVSLVDNTFVCEQGPLCRIEADAIGRIVLARNRLSDTEIVLASNNLHRVEVANNVLEFRHVAGKAFSAIEIGKMTPLPDSPGFALVSKNQVLSESPQPDGSVCIAARFSDPDARDSYEIVENVCAGSAPLPKVVETQAPQKRGAAKWTVRDNGAQPVRQ